MKTKTPVRRVKRKIGENSSVPRKKGAKVDGNKSNNLEVESNSDSNDCCFFDKVNKFSKQQEFTQCELKKLENLQIKLLHDVPPQHKVELSAGTQLTLKEKNQFKKIANLKMGFFNVDEDKRIASNWAKFCKVHKWDKLRVQPFLSMCHNQKYLIKDFEERKKFVQFLANGLPQRPLYSVYQRFRRLYRKSSSARYTKEEDEAIVKYMTDKCSSGKKPYAALATYLNRDRGSVFQRWTKLRSKVIDEPEGESLVAESWISNKVDWTPPMIEWFIKELLSINLAENLLELKNSVIPMSAWEKMEKRMEIKKLTLKRFWTHQLHMQLFSDKPVYLNDLKAGLINYMYENEVSHPKDIKWYKVLQLFPGVTNDYLYSLFYNLIYMTKRKLDNTKDLRSVIEYLREHEIPKLAESKEEKVMPLLRYNDGKVTVMNPCDVETNSEAQITEDESDTVQEPIEEATFNNGENSTQQSQTVVEWTLAIIENFIKHLLRITLSERLSELRYAAIPKVVWTEMGKAMKIDRNVLEKFWKHQLHMQLFAEQPIYLNDIKVGLIKFLYKEKVDCADDISWFKVLSLFPGVTRSYLSSVFHSMIRQAQNIPNSENNLQSVIEYLHNHAIKKLTEDTHERVLPLLSYENGKVTECNERSSTHVVARRSYKKSTVSENTTIINSPLEKVIWTLPVIHHMIVTLLKVTMSDNVTELKHAALPKVVWMEMERRLNIDRDVLEKFWQHQLHMQLFADEPIHLNDVKVRLIKYIYEQKVTCPEEIEWHEVLSVFPGATSAYLSCLFSTMVHDARTHNALASDDLKSVIEFLHDEEVKKLSETKHEKILPLLMYENGKLEVLRKGLDPLDILDDGWESDAEATFITTQPLKKVVWTLSIIERYVEELLTASRSESLAELKYAKIPNVVWTKMERAIGIDKIVLKVFWQNQLHMQLFANDKPIYLNDLKVGLIMYMYEKKITHQKFIHWDKVITLFPGCTVNYLSSLFFAMVRYVRSQHTHAHAGLWSVIEYLHDHGIEELLEEGKEWVLQPLKYENGKLQLIASEDGEEIDVEEEEEGSSESD